MYVGELIYLDRRYSFIIREKLMKLTPLDDGVLPIMIPAGNSGGLTISTKSTKVQQCHFIGECCEDGKKIIIIPEAGNFGLRNFSMTLPIAHIIEFTGDTRKIAGITFFCEELDWIYDVRQFVKQKGPPFTSDEDSTVYIDGFSKTTTDVGNVTIDGIDVSCHLGLSLTKSFSKTPISLQSNLRLCFAETDDYVFLLSLIQNIDKLLQFLCYRRNINFTAIRFEEFSIGPAAEFQQRLHNLANKENTESEDSECTEKKYYTCATLVESEFLTRVEDEKIVGSRYIPHCALDGKVTEIFQDVIDGKLYLRHIPDTFSSGARITPANFIMIMAAFEGEYDMLNPPETQKPKKILAQNTVRAQLETLISSSTGEAKNIYERFLKQVAYRPLMDEIHSSMKKHLDIIQIFGKHSYGAKEFKPFEIAKRVTAQRDAFAHGNLAKPFEMESVDDIRLMEYLVFAMQLSEYGIPTNNIIGIIKKLFNVNIPDGMTYL